MAKHKTRLGEGAGQCHRFVQLRMEAPEVEAVVALRQHPQAGAEIGALEQMRRRAAIADDRVGVIGTGMPHATEAAAARALQRLQHRRDALAEREVGIADDATGDASRAILAALAHCRDAGDELHLAHRLHRLRPGRAVHRVALDEDGGFDRVAGAGDVREEIVQQVALPLGALPEVMMRVDDGDVRVDHRLRRRRGQPGLIGRGDAPEGGGFAGHARVSSLATSPHEPGRAPRAGDCHSQRTYRRNAPMAGRNRAGVSLRQQWGINHAAFPMRGNRDGDRRALAGKRAG